ncbi:MAG: NUDIX domain-containing protein [Candidatus Niyogibacteria bacterium]|nr:NUDIX domain-containing protein [Candidatus Niyogibacteria bacterium]
MERDTTVGVIVARFQVPELHEGHRHLVNYVLGRHTDVLIVLGIPRGLPSATNPLPFGSRKQMVLDTFPGRPLIVDGLFDHPISHEGWSDDLDLLIQKTFGKQRPAILYGSRDSFIPLYTGIFPTHAVPPQEHVSGTQQRQKIAPVHSRDFRAGIIYAIEHRPPLVYPTVDIAVLRESRDVLLVGRNSEPGLWRFPGGFVDESDPSYEAAILREAAEEIPSVRFRNLAYIGSSRIKDNRYRDTPDSIATAFFAAEYRNGDIRPGDDVHRADWFPIGKLHEPDFLVSAHRPLGAMLLRWILEKSGIPTLFR